MAFNPNAQDLGGGSDGRKGPISDGSPPDTVNVVANRQQYNGGSRPRFTESFSSPLSPAQLTQDRITALQLIITGVFNETLACRTIDDAGTVGSSNIIVAKPLHLRPSVYETDGDFLAIERLTASTRKVTVKYPNSASPANYLAARNQQISPSYQTTSLNPDGSIDTLGSIIWVGLAQGAQEVSSKGLIDLNLESRKWENVDPEFAYFKISSIWKNVYRCYKWDPINQTQGDDLILVAKPLALQGSFWDGQTLDGVSYAVSGGSNDDDHFKTRIAAGDETQDITPTWEQTQIILARFMPEGTGALAFSDHAMWQDMNILSHAFAKRFE